MSTEENLSEIQLRIREVLEKFETLRHVEAHLKDTDAQIREANKKLGKLEVRLEKELEDVKKLERLGLKSLFHKTLGNQEDQLEKERQEYLDAMLKYREFSKEIELMEFEKEVLLKKVRELPVIKRQLESLKMEREKEILSSENLVMKKEYLALAEQMDTAVLLNKEIEEAIETGEKSDKLLSVVISHLKKASDWGQWDMVSKGKSSDFLKHQAIDKAVKYLPKAQHHLNLFRRELADLGESDMEFRLDMVKFSKFTDFFFDNLISDWIIQQKIKSTLGNIETTRSDVRRILNRLEVEKKRNDQRMKSYENDKNEILLS